MENIRTEDVQDRGAVIISGAVIVNLGATADYRSVNLDLVGNSQIVDGVPDDVAFCNAYQCWTQVPNDLLYHKIKSYKTVSAVFDSYGSGFVRYKVVFSITLTLSNGKELSVSNKTTYINLK